MAINWRKVIKVGTSIFDQAWLSGINLLISLVFVRELEKNEFGLYVLLFNTSLFFQGIGGALLSAPYTTIYPRQGNSSRHAVVQIYTCGTVAFSVTAAALGLLGYLAFRTFSNDALMTLATGLGFGACIFGSISKDNIRVFHYSQNDPATALQSNIIYGALLAGSIFLMIRFHTVSAGSVLAVIGFASAAVSVHRLVKPNFFSSVPSRPDKPVELDRNILREFWACGRWAVLGSFVTFLTSNTYPYLAAISFSKSDVADISVARLLSTPIALIGAAWFNLMRPRLSQWAAERKYDLIDHMIRKSVITAVLLSMLTGIAVYCFGDLIHLVFGAKYANLRMLSLLWTAQTGLAVIKGIYAATLMTDDMGFKDLSRIGVITLAVTVIGMLIASTTSNARLNRAGSGICGKFFQIILIQRRRYCLRTRRPYPS